MNTKWRGYTLDEIRLHRVLNKQRIAAERTQRAKTKTPSRTSSLMGAGSMGKGLSNILTYAEYAILAFNVSKCLWRLFHKRKK